jgi:hypothetical protein
MNISIEYNNNEELSQILTILFAMGYKFHGEDDHTPDSVIEKYKNRKFTHLNIVDDSINLSGYSLYMREYIWVNNFIEIMQNIPNLNIQSRIIVDDVGDYKATITKGKARIFGHNVTQEQVEEIYQSIQTLKNKGDNFRVYTQNDTEHRTLMAILYSFGFTYHGEDTYQDAHQFYKEFNVTEVNLYDKTIFGCIDTYQLSFSKDLNNIIDKLGYTSKTISLGKYDAVIHPDHVIVGCQKIEEYKVLEIRNALIKLDK